MSKSLPRARVFAEADIETQKHLFRDAALAHVGLLQQMRKALESKSDGSMPLQFFHDLLDEHFSEQDTEKQIETALYWGRYGEIFSYDPETDRLHLHRAGQSEGKSGRSRSALMSEPLRQIILPRCPRGDHCLRTPPLCCASCRSCWAGWRCFTRSGAGAHVGGAGYRASRDQPRAERPSEIRDVFRAAHCDRVFFEPRSSRWSTATSRPTTRRAERFMVPLLDTLQSIPVLSFLPGVMISMVALFPTRQLGVELGSILLIFTGQVWNMAFSFYSSLKSIPREMHEAAQVYRWSWWQKFVQMELPYAAIGLIWNSMMSVAGGWFFLIACEMFVLGNRDLRLPGLGSYLQTAANDGNIASDSLGAGGDDRRDHFDRPVDLAAGDRVGTEVQVRAGGGRRRGAFTGSGFFEALENFASDCRCFDSACAGALGFVFCQEASARRAREAAAQHAEMACTGDWRRRCVLAASPTLRAHGALVSSLNGPEVRGIFAGAGATFLRVELTLALAGLWTIPGGSDHRPKPTAFVDRSARRTDRRVGSGDRAVPDYSA